MGPEELERVEGLLSAVAFRHLQALMEEREDVMVALLDEELTTTWALPRRTGAVLGRTSAEDRPIDLRRCIAEKDRARFEAAAALALRGESVEFLGAAAPSEGPDLLVRTIMWPTNDRSAVVSATTIEGAASEDAAATAPGVNGEASDRHRG